MKLFKALAVSAVSVALVVGGGGAANAATEGVRDHSAPTRIHVGGPYMELPVTVLTHGPGESMGVDLVDPRSGSLASDYVTGPVAGRPTVFKLRPALYDWQISGWGRYRWEFDGYRYDSYGDLVDISSESFVDVRAHSMLGMSSATRSGSTVTVRGSLRAYNTKYSRYASWSGKAVSIQRHLGGGKWGQVSGILTDRNGNLTARVNVPARSTLRLVVKDSPGIWGAVTSNRTV